MRPAADLILVNADIRTMDAARPRAEALAVREGRLLALGRTAEIRALGGAGCIEVDAGGRLVLPGFQDAHVHLLDGGVTLAFAARLDEVTTVAALQQALAVHAARTAGPLVLGIGWQAGLFGDDTLTAAVLDEAVRDRPAIVYDSSGHNACLNSSACARVGLRRGLADPPNGHFVLTQGGEPTGMLHEEAATWAMERLPRITDAQWLEGLRVAQAHANRHGLTGIVDPKVDDPIARAYATLDAEGALTLRVSGAAWVTAEEAAEDAVARLTILRHALAGTDFRVNAAKIFLDGVIENRTAAMLDPYADAAGGNAPLMVPPDRIAALFTALDAARFQIHVHAIGDAAVRAALDGLEAAQTKNGPWPALHQIAHLQMMHPEDMPRLARLAMANIQPLWARLDPVVPDDWLAAVGPARAPMVYAFRQMLTAGAGFCLSSDWPVTTLNPFEIIETAVTRQPPRREGLLPPFHPAERLTVEEAVVGYTAQAAAACWRGGSTGRLLEGFSADLIVLDRDIFSCGLDEIGETEVLLTLFKGRAVHATAPFA